MDIIIYLYIFYISNMIYSFCVPVCVVGGGGGVGTRVQEIQYQLSCLDKINWGLMYPFVDHVKHHVFTLKGKVP